MLFSSMYYNPYSPTRELLQFAEEYQDLSEAVAKTSSDGDRFVADALRAKIDPISGCNNPFRAASSQMIRLCLNETFSGRGPVLSVLTDENGLVIPTEIIPKEPYQLVVISSQVHSIGASPRFLRTSGTAQQSIWERYGSSLPEGQLKFSQNLRSLSTAEIGRYIKLARAHSFDLANS